MPGSPPLSIDVDDLVHVGLFDRVDDGHKLLRVVAGQRNLHHLPAIDEFDLELIRKPLERIDLFEEHPAIGDLGIAQRRAEHPAVPDECHLSPLESVVIVAGVIGGREQDFRGLRGHKEPGLGRVR